MGSKWAPIRDQYDLNPFSFGQKAAVIARLKLQFSVTNLAKSWQRSSLSEGLNKRDFLFIELLIVDAPFVWFFGAPPKKPTKNYILVSPFDSKQMVRPHSWRSPEERTFRPHPPTIRFYEWWEVGYLGGIFMTSLLQIGFLRLNVDLSVTKPLSFGLNLLAKKGRPPYSPFLFPFFPDPQTRENMCLRQNCKSRFQMDFKPICLAPQNEPRSLFV